MNKPVMRKITVTTSYAAMSATSEVCSFTLSAAPANVGTVTILGDTADEVPLIAGEWHEFTNIDLADIQIKGTADDIVTVVGGSWGGAL